MIRPPFALAADRQCLVSSHSHAIASVRSKSRMTSSSSRRVEYWPGTSQSPKIPCIPASQMAAVAMSNCTISFWAQVCLIFPQLTGESPAHVVQDAGSPQTLGAHSPSSAPRGCTVQRIMRQYIVLRFYGPIQAKNRLLP